MAAEEEGVVYRQRDVPIGPLKTVVVPFDITILWNGFYVVPFIEEVVRCLCRRLSQEQCDMSHRSEDSDLLSLPFP